MRYKQFKIIKYKSISKPIVVDIKRNKLLPIIGENECGKTTILKAIFAFDYFNDKMINGEHLTNVKNQYQPADNEPSKISATIELDESDKKEYLEIIKEIHKKTPLSESAYDDVIKTQPTELTITRYFNGEKIYKIEENILENESKQIQDAICQELIGNLPYIVYFDDFLESIPDEILITEKDKSSWQETMDLLLASVNKQYSTTSLKDKEENAIDSIESDVSGKLSDTISRKWTDMRLEDANNFKIKFSYDKTKPSIKLKIVETIKGVDANGKEKSYDRTFDIRQRSKGFYWFFNFVIKSEFNPKADLNNSTGVIFLLDEPGAYLHVSMQEKLCEKLAKLSETSTVIYCTHSHNLLKPEHIDISNIHICHKEKENNGNILMQRIGDYADNSSIEKHRKSLAFEPVYHVLGVSDVLVNGTRNNILLTEGINDFYTFQMFKDQNVDLSFLPSTNANHIQYNIPTFLACDRKFMCLFDSDTEGKKELELLRNIFGEEIDKIAFKCKEIDSAAVETECLYDEQECKKIQKDFFNYADNQLVDTKKLIKRIFFAPNRSEILAQMPNTKAKILAFLKKIEEKFKVYYGN